MRDEFSSSNVIAIEEINTILDRYNIGKKPLAKVLGWGETTIIRYLEGDIPSIEYSNRLKQILSSPITYLDILNRNKDNITKIAYRKSAEAVMQLITRSKINIIAQYIVNQKQERITLMELQLLLHYIQGFSLGFTDKPMFEDVYNINSDFLPFDRITQQYISNEFKCIKFDVRILSQKERDFVDCVIDAFDWYGIYSLKCFVADERFQYTIHKDESGRQYVAKEILRRSFKDIIAGYNIKSYREIHKYADAKFLEIRKLS